MFKALIIYYDKLLGSNDPRVRKVARAVSEPSPDKPELNIDD
jgi:hypothetical protein